MTVQRGGIVYAKSMDLPVRITTKFFQTKMGAVSFATEVLLRLSQDETSRWNMIIQPVEFEASPATNVTIYSWDASAEIMWKWYRDYSTI